MKVGKAKKKTEFIEERKPKIVLITGWWNEKNSSVVGVALKLINTLKPISDEITWIITNHSTKELTKVNLVEIKCKRDIESTFLKVLFYFLHQAKITLAMLKLIRLSKVDIFIFAFGADSLIFPIVLGRFFRKKVILRIEGRNSTISKELYRKTDRYKILPFLLIENIAFIVVHRIAIEFEDMVERYSLQKYQHKISVWSLYVGTSFLRETKKLVEKPYQIGYIGRLSEEKGVLEFAESLSLILKNKQSKAIVIGSGNLEDEIKEILVNNNIQNEVNLVGWIENKDLPHYLNDIQIVVVPSYREGLPNIVLESMACGCVVLATPVGGIPDVIKDGETGFIMEDNSPECIAKNVIRALNYPNLDKIVKNARELVEQEFTYDAAVERCRRMLENILGWET